MTTLEFKTTATEGQVDPLFYILDENTYSLFKRELNSFDKIQEEVFFKTHGTKSSNDFSFENIEEWAKKWEQVDRIMEHVGYKKN